MAAGNRFLILSIEDENYAVAITRLLEITESRAVQLEPQSAGPFEGKLEFRGSTIPVLNLKKFFKISGRPSGTALLVVKSKKGVFGLLADTVTDIMDTEQKPIPIPNNVTSPGVRCYNGILRYKENLVLLLNEDGLLP